MGWAKALGLAAINSLSFYSALDKKETNKQNSQTLQKFVRVCVCAYVQKYCLGLFCPLKTESYCANGPGITL